MLILQNKGLVKINFRKCYLYKKPGYIAWNYWSKNKV